MEVIHTVFRVMELLILARVFMSLIRSNLANPIFRFVYDVTEPILGPIRRRLPATGPVDFSPLVALIILGVVEQLVIQLLYRLF